MIEEYVKRAADKTMEDACVTFLKTRGYSVQPFQDNPQARVVCSTSGDLDVAPYAELIHFDVLIPQLHLQVKRQVSAQDVVANRGPEYWDSLSHHLVDKLRKIIAEPLYAGIRPHFNRYERRV